MLNRSSNTVVIKGYGSDVNIILNNEADFADVEADLIRTLERSADFFSGRKVVLDVGDRILRLEECDRLMEIITNTFNLFISYVRSNSDETRKTVEDFGWILEDKLRKNKDNDKEKKNKVEQPIGNHNNNPEINKPVNPMRNINDTYLFKGTFRGGQKVAHRGNIVIIGDVNPGAEVVATGDIVVIGKLRGVAHAGAQGNTSATIIALDLHPIQLRIAGCIGRSPDSDVEKGNEPEIAEIEDGQIVIHKLRN